VKLDIELCREIERDSMRGALAQALATFTTGVGSTLVAEGVETREAVQELMDRGSSWARASTSAGPGPWTKPSGRTSQVDREAPRRA